MGKNGEMVGAACVDDPGVERLERRIEKNVVERLRELPADRVLVTPSRLTRMVEGKDVLISGLSRYRIAAPLVPSLKSPTTMVGNTVVHQSVCCLIS